MRREFQMTQGDMETLLSAMKPVPYLVVGGREPRSQQENANAAWIALGARLGFDGMTVEPSDKGPLFFTAEAK